MTAFFYSLSPGPRSTPAAGNGPGNPRAEEPAQQPARYALRRAVSVWAAAVLAVFALAACNPDLGSSTKGWTPATAGDGEVYVVTQQGEVKALADDGFGGVRLRWTYHRSEDQPIGSYNNPVIGYGLVYVGGIDGVLYALDQGSGALSWQALAGSGGDDGEGSALVGSPALDLTRNLVVVASEDGSVYAYRAHSGELLWRFPGEGEVGKIWTTPAIGDRTVFVGSHDQNIYAVDLETGAEKWRHSTGGTVVAKPLIYRDMVVVGSFDRKLYALDADDGVPKWIFEGSSNWYWAGAVASQTTIYAPSMDGHVYALDRSGNLLWKHDVGEPVVSTPALLPGGLVVATREGKINLLNPTPGDIGEARAVSSLSVDPAKIKAPIFYLPVDEEALSRSGIQDGADDQRESVYIGAQDGTVRRIQVKSGQVEVWCFNTEEDAVCN